MPNEQEQPSQNLPAKLDMTQYTALTYESEALQDVLTALTDNLAGQPLTDRDLQRITVPSQGMEIWQLPTSGDGPGYHDSVEGIIIHTTTPRAYWPKKMDEVGRTPPECSSPDGITGQPFGDCLSCAFNQWGSDPDGNGKACREQRLLFMLRPVSFLPVVIQVPPTSIDAIKKYAVNIATTKGKPLWKVVTSLKLIKVDADPFPYSRIIPTAIDDVPNEYVDRLAQFRDGIRPLFGAATFIPLPAPEDQAQNQQTAEEIERKVADLYANGNAGHPDPTGGGSSPGQGTIIDHNPSPDRPQVDPQPQADPQPEEVIPDPFR